MSRFVDDFGAIYLEDMGFRREEITQSILDELFETCKDIYLEVRPEPGYGYNYRNAIDFVDEVLIYKATVIVAKNYAERLLVDSYEKVG